GSLGDFLFGGSWHRVDVPLLYTYSATFDPFTGAVVISQPEGQAADFTISTFKDQLVIDAPDWVQTRALIAKRKKSFVRGSEERFADVVQPNTWRIPLAGVTSVKVTGTDQDDHLIVHPGVDAQGNVVPFTIPVVLIGLGGNDLLVGGDGPDYLDGGKGNN